MQIWPQIFSSEAVLFDIPQKKLGCIVVQKPAALFVAFPGSLHAFQNRTGIPVDFTPGCHGKTVRRLVDIADTERGYLARAHAGVIEDREVNSPHQTAPHLDALFQIRREQYSHCLVGQRFPGIALVDHELYISSRVVCAQPLPLHIVEDLPEGNQALVAGVIGKRFLSVDRLKGHKPALYHLTGDHRRNIGAKGRKDIVIKPCLLPSEILVRIHAAKSGLASVEGASIAPLVEILCEIAEERHIGIAHHAHVAEILLSPQHGRGHIIAAR